MMRSATSGVMLGITGALALVACVSGPGRDDAEFSTLLERVCERAAKCACDDLEFACSESFDGQQWLPTEPLPFDSECAAQWFEWVDTIDCSGASIPELTELCPIYTGTQYEGMPCGLPTNTLGDRMFTDCARGLYCINAVCRDPHTIEFGVDGQPCRVDGSCEPGSACEEGICERIPKRGEPCPNDRCEADARCVLDECVALPGPGQPCLNDTLCRSDSRCVFDQDSPACIRKGSVGDPCFGHRECQSENCPAGRCEPPATAGDPCSGNLPCGPDHRCFDGVCQLNIDSAATSCDTLSSLVE